MLKLNRRVFVKRIGQAAAAVSAYGALSGSSSFDTGGDVVRASAETVKLGGLPTGDSVADNLARMQSWLLDETCVPEKDAKLIAQISGVYSWVIAAFLGQPVKSLASAKRRFLTIGNHAYPRGVASHINNPVMYRLPEPGRWLHAHIGVDDAKVAATAGHAAEKKVGTPSKVALASGAILVVLVNNQEVFRSGVLRSGQAAVPVKIDLKGAREFTLNMLSPGGNIPVADLGDWASAKVTFTNGQTLWLDEMSGVPGYTELSAKALPFSLTYGGKNMRDTLGLWKRHVQEHVEATWTRYTITYTEPVTKLEVRCDLRVFNDFPALEWVLHLTNNGSSDTPIIENILPLDLNLTLPLNGDFILHHSNGSSQSPTDFLPHQHFMGSNDRVFLAPQGGRSSDTVLPFFNLQWSGGGMVCAIGWTGQWSMNLQTDWQRCGLLQAGQQTTHFKLHPGESVRTPRIALLPWQGDSWLYGTNLFRRLLLAHFVARVDGKIAVPPLSVQGYSAGMGLNGSTAANQVKALARIKKNKLGSEAYWLDAGWFKGGWPEGVGNWMPKVHAYPQGLRPLGKAANDAGMQFILWFEPERVGPGTAIATQHPQWVMKFSDWNDGLFALGNPQARKWMTALLANRIRDWRIGILRQDFNITPLPFWQTADKPDRQGISEIRYIEGLYAMWDELRHKFPYLAIDCCASGGRRIDLETLQRCFYLWRSDTVGPPEADQVQTGGLSLYVPTSAGGAMSVTPYPFRSNATAGTVLCTDTWNPKYDWKMAIAALDEVKTLRPFYFGDYYPISEITASDSQWIAWQFDRPEIRGGFAMYFRRPESSYMEAEFALQNLEPQARYEVTIKDAGYKVSSAKTMTGTELTRYQVTIPHPAGSFLIVYRRMT